jgi:hypothetical protein
MEQNAVVNILSKGLGVWVATVALTLFAFGAAAQNTKATTPAPKVAAKPAACNALKAEADCKARSDCEWVSASIDPKTQKEKRRAYCKSKPKPKTPAKSTKDAGKK